MGRLICISLLLLALYSSIVQPANGCACKRQIIRDQVCRADFVGVVELLSQAHDASLNASRYKGNYVDTFRANFIIDDLSTTIWARQLICGHQRMNLDFDQSQTANRNNTYFLIAGGNRRHLTVTVCTSIVHQWQKISAYDKKKLTKDYFDKACACHRAHKACRETFSLDFIAHIVTF